MANYSAYLLAITVLANSSSNVSVSTLLAKYSSSASTRDLHILDSRNNLSFSCTALSYVRIALRVTFIIPSSLGGCVRPSFARICPWTVNNLFSFSTLLLQDLHPFTKAMPTRCIHIKNQRWSQKIPSVWNDNIFVFEFASQIYKNDRCNKCKSWIKSN